VRSGGVEEVPLASDDGRKGFYGGGRCGVTLGGGEGPQSSLITSRVPLPAVARPRADARIGVDSAIGMRRIGFWDGLRRILVARA